MKFWIPWTIDAITGATVIIFFFVGLADGSITSFNISIWITALALFAIVLPGTLWLKNNGRPGLATLLLLPIAIPAVLSALVLIIFVLSGEKWV